MPGLTVDGFEAKTTGDVLEEINGQQRADISPGLNLSSASVLGNINGIFAAKLGEIWELARAVYSAFYPDSASGSTLDNVCSITGTERNEASKSQLNDVTVNVEDGFSASAGDMIAYVEGDPVRRFVSKDSVSNSSGVPADFAIDFEAETAGAIECLAGQLNVIAEPLTGWNSVTNPDDADLGREIDTDQQLRVRRNQELAGGSSTADAIRTDILQNIDAVTFCRVLENDTDVDETGSGGLPAKSIEVIARGPDSPETEDNDALAAQILKSKPGGIRAYGTSSTVVTDDQGNEHTIGYTRPTIKPVYLEIDLTKDPDLYPSDGDDLVAEAMVKVGTDNYAPGIDVIAERLKAAAFSIIGVVDVTELRLDFTASPTATANLAIGPREIADLDTSLVLVTSSDV